MNRPKIKTPPGMSCFETSTPPTPSRHHRETRTEPPQACFPTSTNTSAFLERFASLPLVRIVLMRNSASVFV